MSREGTDWRTAAGAAAMALASHTTVLAQSGIQLTGKEVAALVTGKSLVMRTDRVRSQGELVRRSDGGMLELVLVIRSDGSFRTLCTVFDRRGGTSQCDSAPRGSVGVWEIQGDTFCHKAMPRMGIVQCYFIDRDGTRHRFRQSSGPRSIADDLTFDVRP